MEKLRPVFFMYANHHFALQIKTHLILIFCEVGAIIDFMSEMGNLCYEERLSNLPDIQLIKVELGF